MNVGMVADLDERESRIAAALAGPTINADMAPGWLEQPRVDENVDRFALRRVIRDEMGLELLEPWSFRYWGNLAGTRCAVLIAHRFGPPMKATAEIVFITQRMAISRRIVRDALGWLAWDLGVHTAIACIPVENRNAQDIARRLGFTFVCRDRREDGRLISAWSLDLFAYHESRFVEPRPDLTSADTNAASITGAV